MRRWLLAQLITLMVLSACAGVAGTEGGGPISPQDPDAPSVPSTRSPGSDNPSSDGPPGGVPLGEYGGEIVWTAPETVHLGGEVTQWVEHRAEVTVVIGGPMGSPPGTLVETNPFNLQISTLQPDSGVFASSAVVSLTPSIREVLLQFWEYRMVDERRFEGRFADSHAAEGSVLNYVMVPREISPRFINPFPEPIEVGATVSGTLGDGDVHIVIAGSLAGYQQFHAEVKAQLKD